MHCMPYLLLIRHGDYDYADARPENRGQVLTKLGLQQAKATAEWLAGCGNRVEAVRSSDFVRAQQTAAVIAQALPGARVFKPCANAETFTTKTTSKSLPPRTPRMRNCLNARQLHPMPTSSCATPTSSGTCFHACWLGLARRGTGLSFRTAVSQSSSSELPEGAGHALCL